MISLTADDSGVGLVETRKPPCPNILYVATTRHYGGLELASIRLADLLMRTQPDCQRILFACRPGQHVERECREMGIPTVPLTVRNSGDLGGVGKLMQIVREQDIDIVHVHSRRDYVTAVLAKYRLRAQLGSDCAPKLLLHMHLLRALGSPALLSGYFFAPNVDRFLAVSGAVRDYLLSHHRQLTPDQVVVVPNSVDVDQFRLDADRGAAVRRVHGIPLSAIVIGMVGRLDTKGQREAIEALGYLKRPDVYLMLIGSAGRNRYPEMLKRRAKRLGIGDNIIFCGAQQDVAPYLSAMDIFVHLPRDEAFGLAPAEAMAAGLPVLVSNVGGCVELVEDGLTGLVAKPRDRSDIRDKILQLVDSPSLRARLADAGGEFVRRRFSTQAQATLLTELYAQVMEYPACAQQQA